jgi:hypothetical protein
MAGGSSSDQVERTLQKFDANPNANRIVFADGLYSAVGVDNWDCAALTSR